MLEIGKSSQRLRFFHKLAFVSVLALSAASATADTFCDYALRKSDSFIAPLSSQVRFQISAGAIRQAREYGITPEELEVLVSQSKINSYERNGQVLLPIFRTVRTPELYRDYIFMVKLRRPFLVGRKSNAYVLSIEKISEKKQKPILIEIARRLKVKPQRLRARIRGLEAYGFSSSPVTVEIAPAIVAKLQFKHKINLTLLRLALEQTPDKIVRSDRADDRIEMFYYGEGIALTIVLSRHENENTTSLVTSYFTKDFD